MSNSQEGKLIVISGPSGAGKSTLVRRLIEECSLPLILSVSATTRPPRKGEADGVDYHFLSRDEFEKRRKEGAFLECKEVFGQGNWYGTLRSVVSAGLSAGKWVILEIDVEGAMVVFEQMEVLSVFVHPGSMEELERRLRARGTETDASIERRLEVARREMAQIHRYQFELINDTLDETVQRFCTLLCQARELSTHA